MGTLERIDEALWLAEGETISFYGFAYPTRSVIVRLKWDRHWVWSSIHLSDELRGDIGRLRQVARLVSPNKLHHLYLAQWKSAYPVAKLWGPQSTVARGRELEFAGALGEAPPAEWGGDIDQAWFRGSFAMDEVIFFHLGRVIGVHLLRRSGCAGSSSIPHTMRRYLSPNFPQKRIGPNDLCVLTKQTLRTHEPAGVTDRSAR